MKISELVQKGHSIQEIARELEVTRQGVYKWMKTNGDKLPRVYEAALRQLRPEWFQD